MRIVETACEPPRISLTALPGIPLVKPGDRIASLILDGVARVPGSLSSGDLIVIAQKIVSKSEGRYVDLRDIVPSSAAVDIAREVDKDPRFVEVVLSESRSVLRKRPGILIVEHRLGFVLANAGVDQSNVPQEGGSERVLLLPEDPDGSAERIRGDLHLLCAADVGVVINDSIGRAWRNGAVGTAIGASGVEALLDLRGRPDIFDRKLQTTEIGHADEIAAAASILMGQGAERTPAVWVQGISRGGTPKRARALVRARAKDLFR